MVFSLAKRIQNSGGLSPAAVTVQSGIARDSNGVQVATFTRISAKAGELLGRAQVAFGFDILHDHVEDTVTMTPKLGI